MTMRWTMTDLSSSAVSVSLSKWKEGKDAVSLSSDPKVVTIKADVTSPSPDGEYFTATDRRTGNLAIVDRSTGKKTTLTSDASWRDPHATTFFHVWSPDSQRIAYSWFTSEDNVWTTELRTIQRDGKGQRTIYRDPEIPRLAAISMVEPRSNSCCVFGSGQNNRACLDFGQRSTSCAQEPRACVAAQRQHFAGWRITLVYDIPTQTTSRLRDIHIVATNQQMDQSLVCESKPRLWTGLDTGW